MEDLRESRVRVITIQDCIDVWEHERTKMYTFSSSEERKTRNQNLKFLETKVAKEFVKFNLDDVIDQLKASLPGLKKTAQAKYDDSLKAYKKESQVLHEEQIEMNRLREDAYRDAYRDVFDTEFLIEQLNITKAKILTVNNLYAEIDLTDDDRLTKIVKCENYLSYLPQTRDSENKGRSSIEQESTNSFMLNALTSISFKIAMGILILAASALLLVALAPVTWPVVGAIGAAVVGYLGLQLALGLGIGAGAIGVASMAGSFFASSSKRSGSEFDEDPTCKFSYE